MCTMQVQDQASLIPSHFGNSFVACSMPKVLHAPAIHCRITSPFVTGMTHTHTLSTRPSLHVACTGTQHLCPTLCHQAMAVSGKGRRRCLLVPGQPSFAVGIHCASHLGSVVCNLTAGIVRSQATNTKTRIVQLCPPPMKCRRPAKPAGCTTLLPHRHSLKGRA